MKPRIPQFELPIKNEPYALIGQTGVQTPAPAPAQPDTTEDIFGDVIYSYSRANAIEDGVLVDLMQEGSFSLPLVKEAGFKYPIAMTIGAFTTTIGGVPTGEGWQEFVVPEGQDVAGRLRDVLQMLRVAISRTAGGDTVAFEILVSHKLVRLWSRCGPGDDASPVITIMLQGED